MTTINLNAVHNMDCLEGLRKMEDNSVDCVVTDPPYGLSKEPNISEVLTKWVAGEPYDHGHKGFMGNTWDSFVPHPDIWREVFRVLKPGGHVLCFAGTRTQDLMTIALRLGGFEIRDVIEWLYTSGFPKSMDVSKQFDKRRDDLSAIYQVTKFVAEGRARAQKTNREIDEHFGTNGMSGHWTSQGQQPAVPTPEQWVRLKEFLGLSDEMDDLVYELNERKGTVGEAWARREKVGETVLLDTKKVRVGMPLQDSNPKRVVDITAPATDLARKWSGWGTSLKPAHEPIIVARKPLSGTVAKTVEKYGTGAINIDGCRIGDDTIKTNGGDKFPKLYGKYATCTESTHIGRFPANCVTTDDDAFYSPYFNVTPKDVCKKASKKDRNSDWTGAEIGKNVHPTVKPIDLMAWLVRLVCPPSGVVLDPFSGSGSTLVAAKREGFQYVGFELSAEFAEIARARLGDDTAA